MRLSSNDVRRNTLRGRWLLLILTLSLIAIVAASPYLVRTLLYEKRDSGALVSFFYARRVSWWPGPEFIIPSQFCSSCNLLYTRSVEHEYSLCQEPMVRESSASFDCFCPCAP